MGDDPQSDASQAPSVGSDSGTEATRDGGGGDGASRTGDCDEQEGSSDADGKPAGAERVGPGTGASLAAEKAG